MWKWNAPEVLAAEATARASTDAKIRSAPPMIAAAAAYTPAADVFNFGVMLWEMVCVVSCRVGGVSVLS